MPWVSPMPVYFWLTLSLLIGAWLWFCHSRHTLTAVLSVTGFALFQLLAALVLNWVSLNFHLRILTVIFAAVVIFRVRGQLKPNYLLGRMPAPFWPARSYRSLGGVGVNIVIVAALLAGNILALLSYDYPTSPNQPALLFLPLRYGVYFITNGGNGDLGWGMNNRWHALPGAEYKPDRDLIYAVDVVKVNKDGTIYNVALPEGRFQHYEGFMDTVYAPCFGTVVHIEDGHPDVIPPKEGETLLGNYLVLQCNQYYITMGGFRKSSFVVGVGDQVRASFSMLGAVGSSGQPSIPHLHIHATINGLTGEPVPMLFDGLLAVDQFAVRNQIFMP